MSSISTLIRVGLAVVVPLASACEGDLFGDGAGCPAADMSAGSTCGCTLALPVDTSALTPHGGATIWPFGVHGSDGHQEGHPGIDFTSSAPVEITAAADGEIAKVEVDATRGEYVDGASSVYIKADCGITYDYQPVVLEAGLTVGSRVSAGQKIGVMAEMLPPYGPGRFSFHFDTRANRSDETVPWESFCPAQFMSDADTTTLQGMVDASTYAEKSARTTTLTCADGSQQDFAYAAEDKVCNAHLDEATASALESCLDLGPGRPVW